MIYVNKTAINDEYAYGTKVFVYPSKESSANLRAFVDNLDITAPILVKANQYHCTVIYSDSSCPGVETMNIRLPMVGGICDYEIFDSPQFGKCLVGVLNSTDIRELNRQIRETYGATMRFPTFVPHITLAWGYEGDVPKHFPTFSLHFDAYKVAGIDPNWNPNDLKK